MNRIIISIGLAMLLSACGITEVSQVPSAAGEHDLVDASAGENQTPTASFRAVPGNNLQFSFDASLSQDPDGSVGRYEWDFGDNTTALGQRVSHQYAEAGSYTVTLVVTDSLGETGTSSTRINASRAVPLSLSPGTTWQIQLNGPLDRSVDADMFMVDLFETTKENVDLLREQGRMVVCYFNAGAWENWRTDARTFPGAVIGNENGSAGEKWLDIRRLDLLAPIMAARLDKAVQLGCDGVAPGNVDAYSRDTGFLISAADQLMYNHWLAEQARNRSLSIGLMNNFDQVLELVEDFDWAISENCFQQNKCDLLLPFIQADKAVFGIEYNLPVESLCLAANQFEFDFLAKEDDLQAWRMVCDAIENNTPPQASFSMTETFPGSGIFDFDASDSRDAGMIVSYVWDFGDGSPSVVGQTVRHAYLAGGGYNVVLTVMDDGDLTDAISLPVTVTVVEDNRAPEAQLSASVTRGTAPLTVNFDGSLSTDDNQIVSYDWDFGDNSATASGNTTMYTFDNVGSYDVMLTVTDNEGLSASLLLQIIVTATPPPSAQNIWQPAPGTSWQWQIQGTIDTSFDVDMYNIDLFDSPQATIDLLQQQGRIVICYFSAGSWEDWRTDAADFPASVKGSSNGWPGEAWLDIREIETLAPIMRARLDLAVEKNCDGVEPDNVDSYTNNSGFPLSYDDQLAYNRWLANEAHARGLSIGLKNDLNQIEDLVDYFDWALNEQCFQYNECRLLSPFVDAGKAVFGVEYQWEPEEFCPTVNALNFDWLRKNKDLMAWRVACR